MKPHFESPVETLARLSRQSSDVASEFEIDRSRMRHRLITEVRKARTPKPKKETSSSYGSAWLPGPLSYPWLLMFAGVPKVVEQLLRQF